tara:strand:+ start:274 stop:558 length:285 start_codon:yes stop_codon:yes gene_type:complete
MEPGEFSLHHVDTVHGSGINGSKSNRIGFAVRYISSETIHLEEKNDSAIHICGEKNSYYREEVRPLSDFSKESIIEYAKAMGSAGSFGNKKYVD